MRTLPGDVTVFTSAEPRQANVKAVKLQRWPGKSGSFPSILQRQRDVSGRWPFPANQGWRLAGRKRTPPSTSAWASDEVPMFGLAHGGMAVPVSFLAGDRGYRDLSFGFAWKGGTPKIYQSSPLCLWCWMFVYGAQIAVSGTIIWFPFTLFYTQSCIVKSINKGFCWSPKFTWFPCSLFLNYDMTCLSVHRFGNISTLTLHNAVRWCK